MPRDFFTIDDFDLKGKTLLLRVDINSPINPATREILDDTRICHHIKTLRELFDSKVVLLAHQSRPGKKDFTNLEKHSKVISSKLGKKVTYLDDFFGSRAQSGIKNMKKGDIILLENARFYAEEHVLKGKDYPTQAESHMVSHLSKYADYFVNDAFAAAHRSQPSLTGFTEVLPSLAGRVMEKEITMLKKAMHNKERPSIAVLGGVKVFDSLEVMQNMLGNNVVDKVLTTGVVANIFLLAKGYDLGEPNITFLEKEVGEYEELTEQAKRLDSEFGGRIVVPTDLVLNDNGQRKAILVDGLPASLQIFDIGLDTAVEYRKQILEAKNIILNGPAGVFEIEEFAVGTKIIYNAIAESKGFSVIGGGETVAAARNLKLENKVNHISTGGGACINFLAGKSMPAIDALKRSKSLYEEGHYKC
ncbi:MAG: phosphoglycerate kinase [Candidatus Altiarchaeales archaeon WOR_SM1_79]|nr:MAG: phosphoglycerate kinase [Candidatus Altiarchaeales archaeon WOR_SM1_79]